MKFTDRQIQLACHLKHAGLPWTPSTGHYVYDSALTIRQGSPFQPRVYYIHDLKCFIDYFGSLDELARSVVWLPTFEQICSRIDEFDKALAVRLGLGDHTELDYLYEFALTALCRAA